MRFSRQRGRSFALVQGATSHYPAKLYAGVAELADAPDLGLRNRRFQSVAFHFIANAFYEWKTGFSYKIVAVTNGG